MQQDNSYNYVFKIALVGDESVGKSCLLIQYTENKFISDLDPTIGVEFGSTLIPIDDKIIKLQIWDTAGQKQFRSITRSYYRDNAATLLVYSIKKRETFNNIPSWLEEVRVHGNPNQIIILVGNKSDLEDEREVTYNEGQNYATKHGFMFFEVSAKNHQSVEELFKNIGQMILQNIITGVIDLNFEYSGIKIGNLQGDKTNQDEDMGKDNSNEKNEG